MKTKTIKNTCLALAAIGLASASALATPSYYAVTGHWYEVVAADSISWDDAQTAAASKGGYLATSTSAGENDFIFGLVDAAFGTGNGGADGVQAWLGGYRNDPSQPDITKGWGWAVTGEAWGFTNWGGGEPNGDLSGTGHLTINRFGTSAWNDEGSWPTGLKGFVVEGVPDSGSTLGLLGGAFGVMGFVSRKLRK